MRSLRRLARRDAYAPVPPYADLRAVELDEAAPEPGDASDAELDTLRADLVSELDRRAARDAAGSATFRRVA
jgi:hypothetical protein